MDNTEMRAIRSRMSQAIQQLSHISRSRTKRGVLRDILCHLELVTIMINCGRADLECHAFLGAVLVSYS